MELYLLPLRLKLCFFSTQFSNGKTLGGISVSGIGRYCFKVSVAANHVKFGGVFTEFGLSKLMNKHSGLDLIAVSRGTLHWLSLGYSKWSTLAPFKEWRVSDARHLLTKSDQGACCAVLLVSKYIMFSAGHFLF